MRAEPLRYPIQHHRFQTVALEHGPVRPGAEFGRERRRPLFGLLPARLAS